MNIPKELLEELSIGNMIETNDKDYDVIRNIVNDLSLPKK